MTPQEQIANINDNLDKARNNTERQQMREQIRRLEYRLNNLKR